MSEQSNPGRDLTVRDVAAELGIAYDTVRRIIQRGDLRAYHVDQMQKDFTTIDAQRELDQKHVAALGGQIVKEYADEGKTGTNINRPAFRQMPDDAANGDFDAVCVTYMSRLGLGDAFIIAQYELGKHGVTVELVKEKFTDDLAGYMGKTMTTMMDGVYPKMVSQWTRTKMERMVESGYHCGGLTPIGYMTEIVSDATGFHSADKEPPKRLVPDPDNACSVRIVFDMALRGETAVNIEKPERRIPLGLAFRAGIDTVS